jgi:2-polyprenyl-3-methyl-5-hydroxy-6-metoxy-1,4-benzoquinol methylase
VDSLKTTNFRAKYRGQFDHILLLDIIEHTYSPSNTIEALIPLLRANGTFVFSIPNISHGSIKLKLLQNKFEYTQMGLLDSTHIRFFTLDSIIKLMTDTGLKILTIDRVFESFWHTAQRHKPRDYSWYLRHKVSQDLESYSYQYVVTARPMDSSTATSQNRSNFRIKPHERCRIRKLLVNREPSLIRRATRYGFRKISSLFYGK